MINFNTEGEMFDQGIKVGGLLMNQLVERGVGYEIRSGHSHHYYLLIDGKEVRMNRKMSAI